MAMTLINADTGASLRLSDEEQIDMLTKFAYSQYLVMFYPKVAGCTLEEAAKPPASMPPQHAFAMCLAAFIAQELNFPLEDDSGKSFRH